jgi:pentatricopeptide repeat protein
MWGRSHDGSTKTCLQRGCSTDLILYNVYMDCTLRAGEINKVHGIFMEMKEHGCVPDARSYSILMRGLIKTGDTHAVYNPFFVL